MTEGALFAGVMGFGLGFRRAGFQNLWAVEKDSFCQSVIRTQFPETELFTDVRECGKHNLKPVDVITAGFPCQDLSVAGKRAGLAGSRSGLFWELHRILGELRPAWFVIENVPGLFSSNEGRDFAVVLNALDELGYGLAWRVLNSQFFGVAQRRRRVFIVGRFGKPCPTEVLFEPESGAGDIETGGEERAGAAGEVAGSFGGSGRSGGFLPNAEQTADGYLQLASYCPEVAGARTQRDYRGERVDIAEPSLIAIQDVRGMRDKKQNGIGIDESGGPMYTLDRTSEHAVASHENKSGNLAADGNARALRSGASHSYQFVNSLSPVGGGPDDNDAQAGHLISAAPDPDRVRATPGIPETLDYPKGLDSARYRALGNAVTASVSFWIAKRILLAGGD